MSKSDERKLQNKITPILKDSETESNKGFDYSKGTIYED